MRYGLLQYLQRLGGELGLWIDKPVMLPPGRDKLATCPSTTGSACVAKTIGIVLVACLARSVSVEEVAKITSTFKRTNSAAASCSCSTVSALRNSMTRFLPSTCATE